MHCNVTLLMSMNRGRQNSFYLAKGANAHYIIRLTQLNDFFFISINCPLLWIKFSWKHSFYCKMHEFSFKYIWYLSISFIIWALGIWALGIWALGLWALAIYAYCMEKVHFFSWCSGKASGSTSENSENFLSTEVNMNLYRI